MIKHTHTWGRGASWYSFSIVYVFNRVWCVSSKCAYIAYTYIVMSQELRTFIQETRSGRVDVTV
jgi:hypothetical protein